MNTISYLVYIFISLSQCHCPLSLFMGVRKNHTSPVMLMIILHFECASVLSLLAGTLLQDPTQCHQAGVWGCVRALGAAAEAQVPPLLLVPGQCVPGAATTRW